MHHISDAEIETQRLETIADRREEQGEDDLKEAGPGTFYAHEALHMCSFLLSSFDSEVMHHPSVLRDAELYWLAHRAHDLMFALYQKIGEDHLSA